jgi:hypothetical protein
MLIVAVMPLMPLTALVLGLMGACIGYVNIVAISWIQARVPTDLVGRVMSLVMLMSFGITPLSLGLAGALLDLDATALFLGSGVLVLVVVGAAVAGGYHAAFDAPPPARAVA